MKRKGFYIPAAYQKPVRLLFAQQVLLSLFEVISIGSIFPILFVVVDPAVVTRPSKTKYIYDMFGFTDHTSFFIALVILFACIVLGLHAYKFFLHQKTFSFFTSLQRYIEKKCYEQIFLEFSDKIDKGHPSRQSRNHLFLARRYVSYVRNMMKIMKSTVSLFLVLFVLVLYDWKLVSGIIIGGLVYYLIVFRFFQRKSTNLDEEAAEKTNGLVQLWEESLQAGYLFSLGTPARKYLRIFSHHQDAVEILRFRRNIYGFVPHLILETFFILGVLAFLLYVFMVDKISSIHFIALFAVGGMRSLMAMDNIYKGCMGLSLGGDSVSQVFALLSDDRAPTITSGVSYDFFGLAIKGMSFSYGARPIFSDIQFSLLSGSSVCILGKSGSGKTTLLELLCGFLEPDKGAYVLNDAVLKDTRLYHHISVGFMPQNGYILSETLSENIAFGEDRDEINYDRIREVCTLACVDEFIGELEEGYETRLGTNGTRLSAGQRQRVLLARELYRSPSILFLDEVTNGLDREMTERIVTNLTQLGITLVFTTHKEWLMKYFDTTYKIRDGSIEQVTH